MLPIPDAPLARVENEGWSPRQGRSRVDQSVDLDPTRAVSDDIERDVPRLDGPLHFLEHEASGARDETDPIRDQEASAENGTTKKPAYASSSVCGALARRRGSFTLVQ